MKKDLSSQHNQAWQQRIRERELSGLIQNLTNARDDDKIVVWGQIFDCLGEQFASEVINGDVKDTFDEQLSELRERLLDQYTTNATARIRAELRAEAQAWKNKISGVRAIFAIAAGLALIIGLAAAILVYTSVLAYGAALAHGVFGLIGTLYGSVNSLFMGSYFPFILANWIYVGSAAAAAGLMAGAGYFFKSRYHEFPDFIVGTLLFFAVSSSPFWAVPVLPYLPLLAIGAMAAVGLAVAGYFLLVGLVMMFGSLADIVRLRGPILIDAEKVRTLVVEDPLGQKLAAKADFHTLQPGFEKDFFFALRDQNALLAKALVLDASGQQYQHPAMAQYLLAIVEAINSEDSDLGDAVRTQLQQLIHQAARLNSASAPLSAQESSELDHLLLNLQKNQSGFDFASVQASANFAESQNQQLALALMKVFAQNPNSSFVEQCQRVLSGERSENEPPFNPNGALNGQGDQNEILRYQCLGWLTQYKDQPFFKVQAQGILAPSFSKA